MSPPKTCVGLDIGGVFAKIVVLDSHQRLLHRVARRHHGNPLAVVKDEMAKINLKGPVAVGVTGSYGHLIAGGLNLLPANFVNAEIKTIRRVFPDAKNIINVGGSSVTLVQLDEEGNFLDFSTNSLCAAGTGSFLDQQADRLGLNYRDLKGIRHHDAPPPIATRCSVFAKSDLIHRQQEGYDKPSLWCGLCKSMTGTFLNTLLRGRTLNGLTVLTGGVSQNAEVMRWLKKRYGDQIQTFGNATYSGALGAAYMTNGRVDDLHATIHSLRDTGERATDAPRRKKLQFRKTRYPSFDVAEAYEDDLGNEVRVTHWPEGQAVQVFVGIDVGSTSTKALLMDREERVVADIYRRTAGDPLGATKLIFTAVQELARRKKSAVTVLGAGTTGSGRKLVGQVVGADLIVNEISAHLAGAMHVDARVDTIFEIGGQDSKYIHAKNGRIYDSNMNYVCAAGTGSFVEEQAKKLGFKLEEIGDMVMGIAPPVTSDRCTVFMEQDVDRLLRQGYTRKECMAAVLCSIVKNYFTKVVGRRHVSGERVFFMGATARNKGLVAAFETLMDVEMVVSPYCHVMGCYGVALLVKKKIRADAAASLFKGLDLSKRKIILHTEHCQLCQNHCKITFAEIEGETARPSWGYMCGRDPEEKRVRVRGEFEAFRKRLSLCFGGKCEPKGPVKGTVGVPRCLTTYSLYPLWRRFFAELGYKVVLSERTDADLVQRANELTAADFCFPVKISHGHAAELAERDGVDFLLLPHVICSEKNPKTTNSYYCPYVQADPSVVRSALTLHGVDASRLLTPVVDFSVRLGEALHELATGLAAPLGVTKADIRRAWRAGKAELKTFEKRRREEGERILREIEEKGERAIVLMGRSYNTLDLGANLALPQKIADLGLKVIPMDMLPYDLTDLHPIFSNMYWEYGQHILAAASFIRNHKNLYAVYFSNFACGPDSFLLSLVEEVMGEKPLLILELDEHGGDAGYLTRIEAFLDVVRAWPAQAQPPFDVPEPAVSVPEFKRRKLWLPNMHVIGAPLYAAAMRADGYDAESFPHETHETFDIGRSLTRGSECLPTACTTGTFVNIMRSKGLDPKGQTLFMPSSDGPCRFGQYGLLQRLVLNRIGMRDVAIMSPCCSNSYQGLSQKLRRSMWHALLCADNLFKAVCKVRPYEVEPGITDRVLQEEMAKVARILETRGKVREGFRKAVERIASIPTKGMGSKPLVGVVGEIYVRCNPFCNDNVIRAVERYGGEAWLAPISEWILYAVAFQRWRARNSRFSLPGLLSAFLMNEFLLHVEHQYHRLASPLLDDRREPSMEDVLREGTRFMPMNFSGEAVLTLGRAAMFARQGAALVVNVAPFGCMPGTISAALCREIQAETSVPIVSLFYDGEPGMSQRLEVFLAGLAPRRSQDTAPQHDIPQLAHQR